VLHLSSDNNYIEQCVFLEHVATLPVHKDEDKSSCESGKLSSYSKILMWQKFASTNSSIYNLFIFFFVGNIIF